MNFDNVELGWKYNEKAIRAKGTKEELIILKEAVSKAVETPYTYDRLSILLSKEGKVKEAIAVCKKYQQILNKRLKFREKRSYVRDISSKEKAILKRLEKLQERLK